MYCKKCGALLSDTDQYCHSCGEKVAEINTTSNFMEENISQSREDNNKANNKSFSANLSIIIGVISIICSFVLNLIIIPIATIGLILGFRGKKKNSKGKIGIGLNLGSIIIGICVFIFGMFFLLDLPLKVFQGDEYELKYSYSWLEEEVTDGKMALKHFYKKMAIMPVDSKSITSITKDSGNDTEIQNQLYIYYYAAASLDAISASMNLYNTELKFYNLKDEIYYTTFDFGKSNEDLRGRYYLVMSKEADRACLFIAAVNESNNLEKLDEEVMKILKTIKFNDKGIDSYNLNLNTNTQTKPEVSVDKNKELNSEIENDEELNSILDTLSNWNRYSDLRKDANGKIKDINGEWRMLGDSSEYWKFKNGKFWWYKSVNNLKDSYWYGETQIVSGKAGLKSVGIDENKIYSITADQKVKSNDVYGIVLTPTKIISNGVDKSDTNIPENLKWKYVWILVDHGEEGIEAQVLNVDTVNTSYYIKAKD